MTLRTKLFLFLGSWLLGCQGLASAGSDRADQGNERRLLSEVRQLVFSGRRSGEGYFSADGRRMIFQSERDENNPFYQIYLMDLETGDIKRLSTGKGKTTCAWIHPAENKVLFASTHLDPQAVDKQQRELEKRARGEGSRYSWSFDEHYDIFETDDQGRVLKNLTDVPGYDAEGSWSPDGGRIAFASNRRAYVDRLTSEEATILARDPSYFMDIYIMDADGSNVRRLTEAPGYDGGPFFSPDGKRIVWRRFSEDGTRAEVWTMKTDGTDERQITRLGVMSWAPYYHPSGDYIIFANNAQGHSNFELYLVDVDGRVDPVRVTDTPGFDGLPVFAPDGDRLAWTSSRTGNRKAQIFMADWNDAAARRLLGLGDRTKGTEKPSAREGSASPDPERTDDAVTESDLRLHLGYLASEALAGRLTGSEGAVQATAYVASVFESLGLQPAGDMGGWYQAFEFTAGVSVLEGNRMTLADGQRATDWQLDRDWRPLSFSAAGAIEPSGIVFAGYGIVAPAGNGFARYNAYAGLDVKDKWVMAFRFLPEEISPEHRQHLNGYAGLRYKAMLARDQGARGLILVSGPKAQVKDQLVRDRFENGAGGSSIAIISITDAAAERLLGSSGRDLAALQSARAGGESGEGFELPGVRLAADIRLKQEKRAGRNVLARLNAAESPGDSAVMIGAHVDHIGRGLGTDSLADGADQGKVHHGADDNASGVSALLEIAQYLAAEKRTGRFKPKRDIVFAVWSGEEMGRLGSERFAEVYAAKGSNHKGLSPPVLAYLNMDMVGRLDRHLYLQGVGSSSAWPGEIERRNLPVGLPIQTQDDSYLPTDATSFYLKGVPVLSAFTGAHADYNTPRDTADRINYSGLEKIARFMALMTRSMAQRDQAPDYVVMEKPTSKASRANLRAYVGTIPDYAGSDIRGVRLNGVAKGGPAERAGLRAGDIIVEVAGKKVDNIYDYTFSLNALKVGQTATFVVRRDGRRIDLPVKPESRE